MTVSDDRLYPSKLHVIHAVLLAGTIPLFLGGLLSDIAYSSTYLIQWVDFSSWLIAGGNVFAGVTLLWAVINLIRSDHRSGIALLYTLLLLATWILGFTNSLIHAKDAWASMPTGLVLSLIVVALACVTAWVGLVKFGVGGAR